MRKGFAISVIVLGLGFVPSLLPMPWWSTVPEPERAFFTQTWVPAALLVAFHIAGGLTLLWTSRWWSAIALCFCVAQVGIWWRLSGFFEADVPLLQFIPQKTEMIALSLTHKNAGLALAVLHRDVLVGIFYHVAMLVLIISIVRSLWTESVRTPPSIEQERNER